MSTRPAASATTVLEAADLRFGQVGIASVRVRSADPEAVRAALDVRVAEAPALFGRAPVVVDLGLLSPRPGATEARALLDAIRASGMLPVGLAWGDAETDELARSLGLPLVAKFREAYRRAGEAAANAPDAAEVAPAAPAAAPAPQAPAAAIAALQRLKPVRTGQQVYAQGTDLVVVGAVANGAEVLADGNVHVYGALRGRAFAGASGDKAARIFCREFRAEIVSIAGHYRVFEELPGEYAGQAVQVWLERDKLQFATL